MRSSAGPCSSKNFDGSVESSYGSLDASWTVKDSELVLEQTLEIRDTVAPPSDYAQLRDFFDRVAGAQAAAVVLVRQ